jgi:hypothetical protein
VKTRFSKFAVTVFNLYRYTEAGDHNLPRDIFYNYRLPVVAYGYDIPVHTFFLRSKHITDAIHGLPGDEVGLHSLPGVRLVVTWAMDYTGCRQLHGVFHTP